MMCTLLTLTGGLQPLLFILCARSPNCRYLSSVLYEMNLFPKPYLSPSSLAL